MELIINEDGITIKIDYDTLNTILETASEMLQDEEFIEGMAKGILELIDSKS